MSVRESTFPGPECRSQIVITKARSFTCYNLWPNFSSQLGPLTVGLTVLCFTPLADDAAYIPTCKNTMCS